MNGRKKVVLDQALEQKSSAYLAMWKAIESFDPHAGHWAEPADFGSQEDRINAAREEIAMLRNQAGDTLDKPTERDIRAFEVRLKELGQERSFSPKMRRFCGRLLDKGLKFASQSVELAGTVGN